MKISRDSGQEWQDLLGSEYVDPRDLKPSSPIRDYVVVHLQELLDVLFEIRWIKDDVAQTENGKGRHCQDHERAHSDEEEPPSLLYRRLRREMLAAERDTFARLRDEGRLDDEVMRRVQRELDLEEAMLARD